MWLLDGQAAGQAAGFFQSDFWHAFLTFLAMFFAQKAHVATGGDSGK